MCAPELYSLNSDELLFKPGNKHTKKWIVEVVSTCSC